MSNAADQHVARIVAMNPVGDPSATIDPRHRAECLEHALADPTRPLARSRLLASRWPVLVLALCAAVTVLGLSVRSDHGPIGLPAAAQAFAEQAAAPVLHTLRREPTVPEAAGGPAVAQTETWASRDGSRVRTKTTYADGTFQDLVRYRDGDRYRVDAYWSKDRRLDRGTWQPISPHAGRDAGASFAIAERFAEAVRTGTAQIIGETTIDGTPAYRISDTTDQLAPRSIWTIAKDSERPRLFSQQICVPNNPCQTTTYDVYETSNSTAALSLPDYAPTTNP